MPAGLSSPVARLATHRVPGGQVTPERCSGLLAFLAGLPDPRDRRGLRHDLVGVVAVAVCAVLAGAKSFTAIGEWAADAPPSVLQAVGVRADPLTGIVAAPDEATVRRLLTAIDADHRKGRPNPVPCPALVPLISRRNLRCTGRCPMRAFKEMR